VGTYPQERLTHEDIAGVFFRTATALQYAFFNHVSAELVDLDNQSLQQLRRYRMILLPVPSGSMYKDGKIPGYMALSLRAQAVLIDYVKEGGTLVAYPAPPLGESLKALFPVQSTKALAGNEKMIPLQVAGKSAATPGPLFLFPEASADSRVTPFAAVAGDAAGVLGYENRVGKGLAIVLGTEFDRWVPLQSGSSELDSPLPKQPALTPAEMIEIGQVLEALLQAADISRSVRLEGVSSGFPAQQPYASMLAANEPAALGGGSQYGFLSITNFDGSSHVIRPSLKDPRTGTRLTLPELEIAARDALMLPLRLGFETLGVGGMEPEDEIVYSTAEITAARAMDGALHLDLYSKGKSSLMLRLAQAPSGEIRVGSMSLPVSYAASGSKTLSIEIPPPADRSGRQTLIIPITGLKGIPSPPQMSPKAKVDVRPTIRIPVRSDTAYDLIPPTRVALTSEAVDFSFIHPPDCRGKCKARVTVQDLDVSEVNPEKIPAFTIRAPFERACIRNFEWTLENEGKSCSGTGQVVFIPPGSAVALQRDVDRDGFPDYILENEYLRVILYPQAGARSFAFIRKDTNTSVFTSIGGLRDLFQVQMPNPPGHDLLPDWTRHGIPGMHNRFYQPRITQESGNYAEVRFSYDAPDVAPKGARLERIVRLGGRDRYVEVTYILTPKDPSGGQGYINLNSIALGDMGDENATMLISDRGGNLPPRRRTQGKIDGCKWVAFTSRDGKELFGMSWPFGEFDSVSYDRRDYSLLLGLRSPRWKKDAASHTYHVRYLYAPDTPEFRKTLMNP